MGRVCNGPRVLWAEFVMGRDVPEPKSSLPHPLSEYLLPFKSSICSSPFFLMPSRCFGNLQSVLVSSLPTIVMVVMTKKLTKITLQRIFIVVFCSRKLMCVYGGGFY